MKELWPLEENKYIFLFYGETLPDIVLSHATHSTYEQVQC